MCHAHLYDCMWMGMDGWMDGWMDESWQTDRWMEEERKEGWLDGSTLFYYCFTL